MKKTLLNGIFKENPTFVLFLGMCPTLAVTTNAINGLGMGVSTMIVLIFSNIFISLLRKFIPDKVRIAAYVVVIASFVTIIDLLLKAYVQSISQALSEGLISKDVFVRPDAPITRQEMAKIISQAKKLSRDYNSSSEILEKYADSNLISEWAKEYVSLITSSGLMQGRDSGFCPHDNSTRAEAATVISRMLSKQ